MAKPKYRLSHKKEIYYILSIVVLVVIMLFSLFGPGGYRDLRNARVALQEQRVRVDELKRSNYERIKTIEGLRSSREELEKYAREKGYGREGEIIQHLPE